MCPFFGTPRVESTTLTLHITFHSRLYGSPGRKTHRPVGRGDGHGGRRVVLGKGDRVRVVVLGQLEEHVQHLGGLVALQRQIQYSKITTKGSF